MFRGFPLLLGLTSLLLTGCESSVNGKGLLVDQNEFRVTYVVGGTVHSHVYTIPAGPLETALPISSAPQRVTVIGKDQNGDVGAVYNIIVGPNAAAVLTSERWVRVDAGWIYVEIPHGSGGSPLWMPIRWPWVMGGGVRAGVSGYAANDHIIVTNYPPGSSQTLIFYSETGSGGTSSEGRFRIGPTGPITLVNPTTHYVEGTSAVLRSNILPGTQSHWDEIVATAAYYLSLP